LPALQHDINRPEDIDTEGEDHAADALRYACMSRPYILNKDEPKSEAEIIKEVCAPRTYNQMWSLYLSERYGDDIPDYLTEQLP
jgi:hypothetical protein